MADTVKDANKQNTTKERWLTFSGVRKEAKRVRWPQWKSQGSNPGIIQNTAEVLFFTASFALFFVACELVVTYLLKFIGIGA